MNAVYRTDPVAASLFANADVQHAMMKEALTSADFQGRTEADFDGPTSDLLVLTFDQKGVVLHKEDLTEATRKAAETSRYKMDTRLSHGANAKAEAQGRQERRLKRAAPFSFSSPGASVSIRPWLTNLRPLRLHRFFAIAC